MAASILLRVRDWGHLAPSRKFPRVPGSMPARLANASRPSGATSRLTARLASSRLMIIPCDLGRSMHLMEDHCRPPRAASRSPGLTQHMPPALGDSVDEFPTRDRGLVSS